ncbi:hypothetical protein [Desulfovibrio litoralis]|uniref:Uncharacterized protein n=1 Tax=Desulfovibrio litoralis DSM 11393 TaxID=1121455 RepID=A0A1M7S0W0_9BACT|nr:hypothetical protein [Desulfovibrio litoralis]SHN52098.1 hypothetical protein SAMN02745728_00421 [Desulfovibrio litoralis DSM 11393]
MFFALVIVPLLIIGFVMFFSYAIVKAVLINLVDDEEKRKAILFTVKWVMVIIVFLVIFIFPESVIDHISKLLYGTINWR